MVREAPQRNRSAKRKTDPGALSPRRRCTALRNLPGAPYPRSVTSDCALLNDLRRFWPHKDRLQAVRRTRTVKQVDSWKDAFTFRRFRAGLSLPRFLSEVSPMSLSR